MKKIISFEKEINFSSMIGEITSISLDHSLEFTSSNFIEGNFLVSGSYKMTEASALEEKFSYDIPAEIELSEKLVLDTAKVSIDDFTYEVINDDVLKCMIDVLVEGVEEVEVVEEEIEEEKEEVEVLSSDRECDGDKKEDKEIEIPVKEEVKVEKLSNDSLEEKNKEQLDLSLEKKQEEMKRGESEDVADSPNLGSLFEAFDSTEETFTTYSVYILRKEDTLDKVLDQYKITREQLAEYNDLDRIEIGSKLIIPSVNE